MYAFCVLLAVFPKNEQHFAEQSLRTQDVVGRIGGEEFLCLLPRVDQELTQLIANRLIESINAIEFISEQGESFHISVSIGIRCIEDVVIPGIMGDDKRNFFV